VNAVYGAALIFIANGWTAAAIQARVASARNRLRVERLAAAMAEIEAAS
jgi:hypothetical protein